MLSHKENNPVSHTFYLSEDVVNRYHRGRAEGPSSIVKEWVGLMLPRLVLYPVDDDGKIFLNENFLRMQLLLGTCDSRSSSFELSF